MYDVTYNEILERMLARVSDKFDKREGSVIFDTHSPTAIELQLLYIELNTILAEAYGDSASREYLIKRCKERGITPHEATQTLQLPPASLMQTVTLFLSAAKCIVACTAERLSAFMLLILTATRVSLAGLTTFRRFPTVNL